MLENQKHCRRQREYNVSLGLGVDMALNISKIAELKNEIKSDMGLRVIFGLFNVQ